MYLDGDVRANFQDLNWEFFYYVDISFISATQNCFRYAHVDFKFVIYKKICLMINRTISRYKRMETINGDFEV